MWLLGALAHHTPNVSEIARKLVKSLPYCNRNGHGPMVYFATFLSLVRAYCIVVGQIVKPAPQPQWKVSQHISARRQLTSFGSVVQKQWEKLIRQKFVCR